MPLTKSSLFLAKELKAHFVYRSKDRSTCVQFTLKAGRDNLGVKFKGI